VVLAELGKPENKEALKKYIKSVLASGAKNTFGNVDMTWYSSILKQHGCADAGACQQELGNRIREADAKLAYYYLAVLAASAVAFILLLTEGPGSAAVQRHRAVAVLRSSIGRRRAHADDRGGAKISRLKPDVSSGSRSRLATRCCISRARACSKCFGR
jgi:hypothetical protein